jgi:hypothetical protein
MKGEQRRSAKYNRKFCVLLTLGGPTGVEVAWRSRTISEHHPSRFAARRSAGKAVEASLSLNVIPPAAVPFYVAKLAYT